MADCLSRMRLTTQRGEFILPLGVAKRKGQLSQFAGDGFSLFLFPSNGVESAHASR